MPPPALLEPSSLDESRIFADREEIMRLNKQRYEFQLLDAILLYDTERNLVAGYHDVRQDAWWARGHIPGRPLFPGVLMIEVAAQLASFVFGRMFGDDRFLGFLGVDGVKFRGAVEPPARLIMIGTCKSSKPRKLVLGVQGFIKDAMVFEGEITGMPI